MYRGKTLPVGSFPANRFGLHDVHGNVWEWVEDCWHKNHAGAPTDGRAWTSGGDWPTSGDDCGLRVFRGGSWDSGPRILRSAHRSPIWPDFRTYSIGLRVARAVSQAEQTKRQQATLRPVPIPAVPAPREVQPAVGVYPQTYEPGETFKDCAGCPEMVVIPPGRFRMGDLSGGGFDNEKPVHAVTIGYRFAVGKYEVTRGEFAAFVKDTGHDASGGCFYYTGSKWEQSGSKSWRSPGFSQNDRGPVVCMSWDDAQGYVRWLSGRTGQAYRLLSEAEWEYVARAGTTTAYNTGPSILKGEAKYDSSGGTVGVGSYSPNAFGLYDVHGNVWEWTEDCWHASYHGAAGDGGAWTTGGNCDWRVLRGGSWIDSPRNLRSALRSWYSSVIRDDNYGFRVARTF